MGFNENEYNSLQKDVSDLRVNLNSINEKKIIPNSDLTNSDESIYLGSLIEYRMHSLY